MFIILHGEDSYEREIKRQEILKVFKEKNKILSFEVANFSKDSGFNKAYNFYLRCLLLKRCIDVVIKLR